MYVRSWLTRTPCKVRFRELKPLSWAEFTIVGIPATLAIGIAIGNALLLLAAGTLQRNPSGVVQVAHHVMYQPSADTVRHQAQDQAYQMLIVRLVEPSLVDAIANEKFRPARQLARRMQTMGMKEPP